MKTKTFIISLTIIFLGVTNSFASPAGSPNLATYAGYPTCSDVLKNLKNYCENYIDNVSQSILAEATKLVKNNLKVNNDTVLSQCNIMLNIDMNLPSDSISQFNNDLSDKPTEVKMTTGGCFEGKTKVLRLAFPALFGLYHQYPGSGFNLDNLGKPENLIIVPADIEDINENDYVLSSTISVAKFPEYQKDCWAQVTEVKKSTLKDWNEDSFRSVSISTDDFETIFVVNATSKHRFESNVHLQPLISSYNGKDWKFNPADSLQPGFNLFSGSNGNDLLIKGIKAFVADPDTKIYNLVVPETHTYYVGPTEGLKVLVHNDKTG